MATLLLSCKAHAEAQDKPAAFRRETCEDDCWAFLQLVVDHVTEDTYWRPEIVGPLHLASEHGRPKIVRKLLALGHDAKARTPFGPTALDMAVENGHIDIVKMLRARVPKSFEDEDDDGEAEDEERGSDFVGRSSDSCDGDYESDSAGDW